MQADDIIAIFCESKGITKETLISKDKTEKVRYARNMLYTILRDKCGLSSYKLAVIFNRSRRNVVRGISVLRHHIELYKDVREDYTSLLNKIEGAIRKDAPSADMD